MARNVTTEELRNISANSSQATRDHVFKSLAASASMSTFLSHSSKDKEVLPGAIQVLQNHGASVYIDEIDPEMPPYTSEETAALLKQRIAQTKRFVLLTTKNSKESRWVPWELGIADGAKGLSKIAIFPASDSAYDDSWVSWEYLGLYQRVVWGLLQGHPQELWMVLDTKANTAVPLKDWLAGY
ncbi:hypothetical protein VM99_26395 [Pseudomonas chlororaphis]|uniref:TIR domain-containing protein n=1 Tax=Pseudomonas chlororaphis TaxID=587753 RepID=A0A0G3GPF8_9PSED|nr:hypothetical protein VM99_26395 [Pseudomonas chlororaphis]